MRTNQPTTRWKKLAGDAAVATVLFLAFWFSYGCGGEEPQATRNQVATTQTASPSPRVTPTSYEPEPSVAETRANVTYEEAEGVYRDGRFDQATDLFLIYTSNHPENVWGHYMAGLSAWKAGVLAQAETSFEHALAIDASHVKTLINLGRVMLDQGRPEDAMTHIERALEVEPESVDGFRLRGRANEELGDSDGAIESYRQAIILDPNDAWSMNNLGLVFIREERFGEALPVLALAVEIRDDVPVFFNNLGVALERTDRGHSAADAFDRAIELEPTYDKARENLARVAVQNEGSELRTVDLSVLAEEFRQEVAEWRTRREAVGDPIESDSLPRVIS
jgi:Flp pilus assembly protein TadD